MRYMNFKIYLNIPQYFKPILNLPCFKTVNNGMNLNMTELLTSLESNTEYYDSCHEFSRITHLICDVRNVIKGIN